jgi:hypothetical protein
MRITFVFSQSAKLEEKPHWKESKSPDPTIKKERLKGPSISYDFEHSRKVVTKWQGHFYVSLSYFADNVSNYLSLNRKK